MNVRFVLFGILGFRSLGVRDFPAIDPPTVSVRTNYAGANADFVESRSKMSAYGLTLNDVRNALARENLELPSGKIAGNSTKLTVRNLGRPNMEEVPI